MATANLRRFPHDFIDIPRIYYQYRFEVDWEKLKKLLGKIDVRVSKQSLLGKSMFGQIDTGCMCMCGCNVGEINVKRGVGKSMLSDTA